MVKVRNSITLHEQEQVNRQSLMFPEGIVSFDVSMFKKKSRKRIKKAIQTFLGLPSR